MEPILSYGGKRDGDHYDRTNICLEGGCSMDNSDDSPCMGSCPDHAFCYELVQTLMAPHEVVEVQDVRLDLIIHFVFGKVRHFQHLDDASRIAVAPFN